MDLRSVVLRSRGAQRIGTRTRGGNCAGGTLRRVSICPRNILVCRLLAAMLALCAGHAAIAQGAAGPDRLRIGVAEFAPYAAKGADGAWHGTAVDLFLAAAKDTGANIELVEVPASLILRAINKGTLDGSVLPFADTVETLGIVSLTHDWSQAELCIATSDGATVSDEIRLLVRSLLGRQQWKIYSVLAVAIMIFALIVWMVERRRNGTFEGHRGLGAGVWWSIATLTTVGYGDAVPRTPLGRIAAGGWMLISLVLVALFTATVTSALSTAGVAVEVSGAHDLPLARVGILEDGPAEAYFADHYLPHVSYASIDDAIRQLKAGSLDAVVADRVALESAIAIAQTRQPHARGVRILPDELDRRGVAFGLRRTLPADFLRRFDDALAARIAHSPHSAPPAEPKP